MFNSTKSRIVGGTAFLVAIAVALGVTVAPALDDDAAKPTSDVRIGTYDPEMIFQQYHGLNELIAISQRIQQEAQQAQMQGNQQRLMELQQQMQQEQLRIINQFQADVERIVPDIAREEQLKIVAVELTYVASEFGEPEDISQNIIEKLNEEAPQPEGVDDPFAPAPSQPGQPGNSPE